MKRILLLFSLVCYCSGLYCQSYHLVEPKNGFVFSGTSILFQWNKVDSAQSCDLSIATDSAFNNIVLSIQTTGTTVDTSLPSGSAYYWRIQATTPSGIKSWSYSRMFNIFLPSQIPGLTMWFDANQNVVSTGNTGGTVTQWSDLSTPPVVATQTTPANVAYYYTNQAGINNKAVVSFEGSSYLIFQNTAFANYTALMVRDYYADNPYIQYVLGGTASGICAQGKYYGSGYGSYSALTGATNGPNGDYFGASESDLVGGYSIYTTENSKVFRNGVAPPLGTTQFIPGIAVSCIGTKANATNFAYLGNMAEIVVYNDTLPDAQRLLAEGYLRCKYSNFVDLGPDTTFPKFCFSTTLTAKATLNASITFSSYLWSTGATTSSINVSSFGAYWVEATDLFGYVSTDTVLVKPVIPFNQLPLKTNLCKYDSVVWNTNYPSSGYQFTWSNGSTASSIVIKTTGAYYVKIKDSYGCYFYSDTIHVFLDSFPDFKMPKDTSFCAGNQLEFNYGGVLNSIAWSDGDTSLSTVINTPGVYSVTAVDVNGCKVSDTSHVFIKGIAPVVNFTYTTPCLYDTIVFADSSQAPAGHSLVKWKWDFDNLDTSILENPLYVFPFFGTNTVSLTAVTDSGCSNTISKNIQVNLKPQAYFLANISCAVAKTQFTDYSTTFAPAFITNWDWQFGVGDTSTDVNPAYSFPSPGINNISLKVTDNNGCSNIFSSPIQVFAPLVANFSVNNVCIGDSTAFKDITKSLSITEWLWSFGDGTTLSNIPDPIHVYATPKIYDAGLIIRNAIGCVDSVYKSVNIVTYPTAVFKNLYTCEDAPYAPVDSSLSPSEPLAHWEWTINNTVFNVRAPVYTFADTGTYPVKLIVTSLSGCQDSITQKVYSASYPSVAFTLTPLFGQAPVNVTFTNASTNADFYTWNFGDNSGFSNEVSPQHTYTQDDTFKITLVATSPFGCMDSASNIFIAMPTYLDLSVDKAIAFAASSNSNGTSLVTVNVYCSNLGTRPITEINFIATLGTGGTISEDWNGLLPSGHQMVYTFGAKFVIDSIFSTYVCVDADTVNNGQTETLTDNNSQCNTIASPIELVGPYPNPAYNQATLGIILQQAGQVTVDITDVTGKFIISTATLNLPVGITNFSIPVAKMSAGEYFVRVQYNNEIFVQKFMVK